MRITCPEPLIQKACEIAVADMESNIRPYKDGLLEQESFCIMAGADYPNPWTRDAAINVYNALAYCRRDAARNTLLSVMERDKDGRVSVGGQYWDAVIFALGAESLFHASGDTVFLSLCVEAIWNSLCFLENTEYSPEYGLFRGPAVYGDGVSAYPPEYGDAGTSGFILDFVKAHPEHAHPAGRGIPMHALSTNCVYVNAYRFAYRHTRKKFFRDKADRLKRAILRHFYQGKRLKYLTGPHGDFFEQEGLGIALGRLFDILPEEVLDNVHSGPAGIPCVYPSYGRYCLDGHVGRHSGTVWPFIQCLFANEALRAGREQKFVKEFQVLARHAVRDGQFHEIYHPDTGLPYGGLQEYFYRNTPMGLTPSFRRQTWSATGFLSMILHGILGMTFGEGGMTFSPYLPPGMDWIRVEGLEYRDAEVSILAETSPDGTERPGKTVKPDARGRIEVKLSVK